MNYKHKQTGHCAYQVPGGYSVIMDNGGTFIPSAFIENTTDWQPIEEKKPLFTTEDGVEVFDEGVYWIADMEGVIGSATARRLFPLLGSDTVKRFSTEEAANEYVRLNKPIYSRKDMEEFAWHFINANRDRGQSLVDLDELKRRIKQFWK